MAKEQKMPEEHKDTEKKAQDKPGRIERAMAGGVLGVICGIFNEILNSFGLLPQNHFAKATVSGIFMGLFVWLGFKLIYKGDKF